MIRCWLRRRRAWMILSTWYIMHMQRQLRSIKCFFVDHDMQHGSWQEPDWCAHCWFDDPDTRGKTMPVHLNGIYCWCVEHVPGWNELDWRLINSRWGKYLPSWWEY